MTLEPSEIDVRKKVHQISHTTKHLESSHKTISRQQSEELDSLTQKVSKDPYMTIQLRESSVEKLRNFSITLKGEGSGITYDATLNHCIKLAESALAHGLH